MKRLLLFLIMLTLCLSSSALADAAFDLNIPASYEITLSDALIKGTDAPGISISASGAKLTITLKDNTTCTVIGDYGFAGIALSDAELVIRCERAGERHTCDTSCGKLIVTGGHYAAGIGGNDRKPFSGTVTIMGGQITANGDDFSAGIGAGNYSAFNGKIIITGGIVNANGGGYGTGIGSSDRPMEGTITISGGIVNAVGGESAAGIGSGFNGYVTECAMNGTVEITGGTVTASGGDGGAGIGSGYHSGINGTIKISGGTITANGRNGGAGIGSGSESEMNGNIEISGGTVTANGAGGAAGIGAGSYGNMRGLFEHTGGTVYANGGVNAAGIGAGFYGEMSGKIIVRNCPLTAIAGEHNMASFDPASSIGASAGGTMTDDAVINVDPISKPITVNAGPDAAGASPLEGSPFASKYSLKEALKDKKYAKFIYVETPATPTPAPTTAPSVPETGDSANFAFLALLAVISMIGLAIIPRKKNDA